ncbi:hypothetical protein SRABI118_05168 [Massilia sp. Bi118]|jgi:hypothetical protein|uniref:hypothetical protein n=1 Tax=Massilia sp. Bi118 TaxID=2822346 RepID=UPI001E17FCB1|nr:hypothetical protein [Massilia sp. Bi118]CAH0318979.1 hypothetical protein SRABI118_05168 [Massilia sp. Bi118]
MQIKQRGKVFQLIRYTGYNKDKKRADTQLVGSFPDYVSQLASIDVELVAKLDDDERAQVEKFLKEKREASDRFLSDMALRDLPKTIEKCKAAIEAATQDSKPIADPDAIFFALRDLGQALVKAGYKRPKFTEKAPGNQKDPRQLPITGDHAE